MGWGLRRDDDGHGGLGPRRLPPLPGLPRLEAGRIPADRTAANVVKGQAGVGVLAAVFGVILLPVVPPVGVALLGGAAVAGWTAARGQWRRSVALRTPVSRDPRPRDLDGPRSARRAERDVATPRPAQRDVGGPGLARVGNWARVRRLLDLGSPGAAVGRPARDRAARGAAPPNGNGAFPRQASATERRSPTRPRRAPRREGTAPKDVG